jgi:lysophospholipase L1-like esterase
VPTTAVVAALGDSFTDGLTVPAELTWPARLSHHLGVSVRNYGTAGFGPGQELLVLKQYVRARRPRRVVIGFFAGNDLVDAERFEGFQRDGVDFPSVGRGWKFKDEIARFDELYVTSLYQGVSGLLVDVARQPAPRAHAASEDNSADDPAPVPATRPAFDRGLFTVPVAGRVVQFAFLPPYLNRLTLSRQQLEASRGWQLTRRSYREMQQLLRAQDGELVVLFIPFKAQVYLPLLQASFPAVELHSALRSSLGHPPQMPPLKALLRNRLALNDLMREFCAQEGIIFLDLTPELQSTLRTGHNVYFPDDSHWNAAGHEVAARAASRLLKAQGL